MTDKRVDVSHVALAAAGAALTLLLAACGEGTQDAAQNAGAPTSSSSSSAQSTTQPTTEEQQPTSETTEPGTSQGQQAPAEASGLCKAGDLRLSLGRGDAAAGTQYRPLQFTNVSGDACVIQGFPGVSYVAGDDGHQVGAAAFREGAKGDPVTLNPGDMAYAEVGFVQVRNYDPAACRPTDVRGLRVYAPQETESKFIEVPGTGCAGENIPGNQLTVQTIQPGSGDA
ncbi:hypothetical protein DI005_16630 [Prauserella sp. PE36]|uniref:DUF4232 domain-containing protein n=1 Tax=Prauserella endophytica TaxID=1592324 RepID=A0ABY2SCI1_9PSEU|nr:MULTISPECIES: DUF4232 domain-containing protein [Prauserella]PXY34918.1 hypothetical protein BAY59_05395 [Prauserella coralliicola]RBM19305.1 hypothetical protein DI005_16630 [Prauserella sp. PE36]TKG73446.1 DUF4232 domain-containing protein [Prauserella endophytica]